MKLKKNTIIQKKKSLLLKWIILSSYVFTTYSGLAQIYNNEPLFIGDNGYVYVGSNTYYFGNGNGQTKTSRTTSSYGKLIFSSASSTAGASDSHYLDGYGRVITTVPFIFPVGQSGVYAPAQVTPSSAAPIDAAYFRSSATTVGSSLDTSIASVSPVEYWNINGSANAILSLTWRASSNLSNLVISTNDITIIGYDGTKWVEIPSTVDTTSIMGGSSTITSGSITSISSIDLSNYSYFSFGAKGNSCPPLISSSGNTKTWNGSWSPSAPTLADPVIINSAYTGNSFACNSLVLNADVTLADGQNVEIVNGVTGTGKFIMSSEASVVQRASGVPAPNIELTKKTRNVMRRYDYIYWGTPIAGNFFSQLANAQAGSATLADAFDLKYKYVTGAGGGWQPLTATETGKGFITRIKLQTPFIDASTTDFINLKFTGVANNGDISVPVTNNPAAPNGGTSHPLLANPYPSAIDADKFLTENTAIDGVVYIWTAATLNNGSGQLYSQADYIAYTLAGAVIPTNIATTFNGKIASGQGFRVKALNPTGNVTFTNCMRLLDNNNQFYKSSNSITLTEVRDRFKLNMTGGNGVFSQILIAYMPQASLNYDRLYDAGRNSVSTAQLYSVFEGDGRKLAINARPSFFVTDVVPLGVSKSDTTSENFTISITEKEGIFNSSSVTVYLHDILLDTYFDLSTGDYTFSTNTTSLLSRFEIVYQNGALSTDEFDNYTVHANLNNQTLSVKSSIPMTNVQIFDITGKKIYESNIENAIVFTTPFNNPQAVYIARVKLDNGKTANIKLVNEK
jgi:hypothetical protein